MAGADRCSRCGAIVARGTSCPTCRSTEEAVEAESPTPLAEPTVDYADPSPPAISSGNHPRRSSETADQLPLSPPSRPTEPTLDHIQQTIDAGNPDGIGPKPGTTLRYFGDYEIQSELGRGGMGVVYRARQVSLNRLVALKMVKAGLLAGDEELRRFRNEAEAVALLDHPGIVPVFEVGEHEGQSYFSMKLVEGGSLVPLIERYKADPRASAFLVAEAADAVAHAHMRGILHRDLKPANILVDTEGHPHVTDFGLAKRVEADTELTASGAILGTPAYMSPEQAEGRRGGITTATDVYGLGAVLYTLLTGKSPFGGNSVVQTLDAVRSTPPESPRQLNRNVPRDLETICLKCLEKDPRRRYLTAQSLAEDLRRWLASRPILARRVGQAERAWLWCRRRPAVATLTAAVLIASVGGTFGILAVQIHANHQLQAANLRLKQQRQRAERRELQAISAVRRFSDVVSGEDVLRNNPELEPLRTRLLSEPLSFMKSLRIELMSQLDTSDDSFNRLSQATEDYIRIADAIGDPREALAAIDEWITLSTRIAHDHPGEPSHARTVAIGHYNRGLALKSLGRVPEALESTIQASQILERLVRQDPQNSQALTHLVATYDLMGALRESTGEALRSLEIMEKGRAILEQLVDLHPDQPEIKADLARLCNNIASLCDRLDRPRDAIAFHTQSRDLWIDLSRQFGANDQYERGLGRSFYNLGLVHKNEGRLQEALTFYAKASEIQQKLVDRQPSNLASQRDLGNTRYGLAGCLSDLGRLPYARAQYLLALDIFEKLAQRQPAVTDFKRSLARIEGSLGLLEHSGGQDQAAFERITRAIQIQEHLAQQLPRDLKLREDLAQSLQNLGILLDGMGKLDEARNHYAKASSVLEALSHEQPNNLNYARKFADAIYSLAVCDLDSGHPVQACQQLRLVIKLRAKVLAARPADARCREDLALAWRALWQALQTQRQELEADDALRQWLTIRNGGSSAEAGNANVERLLEAAPLTDNAERLLLAFWASDRQLFTLSARLLADALKDDPSLASNLRTQFRYNAACAAAMAGCGKSKDDPAPDLAMQAKLREQALAWLLAELQAWADFLTSSGPSGRQVVLQFLNHWKGDPDLAGVRDEASLSNLPEPEREPWRALWAQVDAELEKLRHSSP